MNLKTTRTLFIASGFAIVVNILLFAILPNLVKNDFKKSDIEIIVPVNILKLNPPRHAPEKREKPPETKKPEKIIPTVRLSHKSTRIPKIKVKMPRLNFEINPRLSAGMHVSPPGDQLKLEEFYDQGEVDQMPMTILKTKPIYPYRAKRLNITGKVDVKFLVNAQGCVSRIQILKSTPPGIFDQSVRRSLVSWRFAPGKISGRAVSTWVITTIEFEMEGI